MHTRCCVRRAGRRQCEGRATAAGLSNAPPTTKRIKIGPWEPDAPGESLTSLGTRAKLLGSRRDSFRALSTVMLCMIPGIDGRDLNTLKTGVLCIYHGSAWRAWDRKSSLGQKLPHTFPREREKVGSQILPEEGTKKSSQGSIRSQEKKLPW